MNQMPTHDVIRRIASKLFDQRLVLGVIVEVSPSSLTLSLKRAGIHDGVHLQGARHGLGEVGEYVVILSEHVYILARLVKIETRQSDFKQLGNATVSNRSVAAQATAHPLGTIDPETLVTLPGIQAYPRIGDPVFSAPALFLANIPRLVNPTSSEHDVTLTLGSLVDTNLKIAISPEDLLSRHCAILGTTGSGKSWTVARISEETLHYSSKTVLIDSTGEYAECFQDNPHIERIQVGGTALAKDFSPVHFPPSSFSESEFFALFSPSIQTQAPVLMGAIRSLRILKAAPSADDGTGHVDKVNHYQNYKSALESGPGQKAANDIYGDFDLSKLLEQLPLECIKSSSGKDTAKPFIEDKQLKGWCESLTLRVRSVLAGHLLPFEPSFPGSRPFADVFNDFMKNQKSKLLLIDISNVDAVTAARPIIVNAIGTFLMTSARRQVFKAQPLVCILDEAHNFIGKSIDSDQGSVRLSSFESIAREGRKYNLCLCLATQRPRDLSESILSQIGTLVTHRLTNDYDRVLVEKASGDVNTSVTQFLPDLKTGEALVFGTLIPIPLDIQVQPPKDHPASNSADFQTTWVFDD